MGPYTITFYSFKGGVGRTMALVNVAAQLAKMGRKVLLVDFDLEAPGLETFDDLRPHPDPHHPGMVEYLTEYINTDRAPDVREYIYEATAIREKIGKKGGKIWVMPAGRRDEQYQSALAKINWVDLYDNRDGFLLFEDTKAQWKKAYEPDYILIDSRTGHTDVEGICTRQLPDAVVVLFFPNEQNLVGLREVCRRIRGEQTSGLKKIIRLHFVMSNVPDLDDEDEVLRRRLGAFWKELGIRQLDAVIYRYESVMLFNQAIFVLDRPKSRLARDYEELVWSLIVHNRVDRDGALRFLSQYDEYLNTHREYLMEQYRKDFKQGERLANALLSAPDNPLSQIAQNLRGDPEVMQAIRRCEQMKWEWVGDLGMDVASEEHEQLG
jgi:MinD-like ATPase involved in chromosome partitioning or flagellar assembly